MSDIKALLLEVAEALRDYERDSLAAKLEAAAESLGELEERLAAAEADAAFYRRFAPRDLLALDAAIAAASRRRP